MRAAIALSWRLLRSGDRRNRLGALLVLVAVAASTTLMMFAIAANHAFDQRVERAAWRTPEKAAAGTAIEAMSTDYVRGKPIVVVDLAAAWNASPPVPPGMDKFPKPGEVWLSPGLADLAHDLPSSQLADRFPGKSKKPTGELGDEALVHPGELVAVVGHSPGDAAMTAHRVPGDTVQPPTRIDGFATEPVGDWFGVQGMYAALAKVASVLMLVPLLVFGGAAARLTVARRDQRLAALRLVGATPRQVVVMTVAEAMVTALFGAMVGVALYAAAAPAITRIPMMGGTWYIHDVWPGAGWTVGALLGVPLLIGASAVVGLRRVVVSPLGVANRQTPPGLKVIRAIVAVVLILAFPVVVKVGGADVGVGIGVALLALAFLALNLAGPWVVGIVGRITAGLARRPAKLLAGRRLVDDPRSAWRTVSGVALVGFVAGFLALFDPSSASSLETDATRLSVSVATARADATAEKARHSLDSAHLDATVGVRKGVSDTAREVVVKPAAGTEGETVRTALAGTAPGHMFTSTSDEQQASRVLFRDVRTGALIVLAVCFLIAMVSSAITAVSAVLDRRRTYALLRLAGTPLSVLDRARLLETTIPLAVMGGGSLCAGVLCGVPIALTSPVTPYGLLLFLAFVGLGTFGVIGANALSRPLLRTVTSSPSPQPD